MGKDIKQNTNAVDQEQETALTIEQLKIQIDSLVQSNEVLAQKLEESEAVRAELTTNEQLKAQIESLAQSNEVLAQKLVESETGRAELATKILGEDPKGFVEIAAIPRVPGMRFGAKSKGGVSYPSFVDPKDGFERWKVPVNYAGVLCGEKAGLQHVFMGPGRYLDTTYRVKGRVVHEQMKKHHAQIVDGKYVLLPAKVEE